MAKIPVYRDGSNWYHTVAAPGESGAHEWHHYKWKPGTTHRQHLLFEWGRMHRRALTKDEAITQLNRMAKHRSWEKISG